MSYVQVQLSPYVRNLWLDGDWQMLEDLLPIHFWRSTSKRNKYDHWQNTFNSWVTVEGSAPSIQIMKNIMEKVKKSVRAGSQSFKTTVPALYEIACYLTSTACCSSIASKIMPNLSLEYMETAMSDESSGSYVYHSWCSSNTNRSSNTKLFTLMPSTDDSPYVGPLHGSELLGRLESSDELFSVNSPELISLPTLTSEEIESLGTHLL